MKKRKRNSACDLGIGLLLLLAFAAVVGMISLLFRNETPDTDSESSTASTASLESAKSVAYESADTLLASLDMSCITEEHSKELYDIREWFSQLVTDAEDENTVNESYESYERELLRFYDRYFISDFKDISLAEYDIAYENAVKTYGDDGTTLAKYKEVRKQIYLAPPSDLSREKLSEYKTEIEATAAAIPKENKYGRDDNSIGIWELPERGSE